MVFSSIHKIARIIGATVLGFMLTTASSSACMPLQAPSQDPPMALPNIAFFVGYEELTSQHRAASCALKDFQIAISGFRKQEQAAKTPAEKHEPHGYLMTSLAYAGIASDWMGNRAASIREWSEAMQLLATLYNVGPPVSVGDVYEGNQLFSHRHYQAAFEDYRRAYFPKGGNPNLNEVEIDSGAAGAISKGLEYAINGKFQLAINQFSSAPQSQVASYLEAQAARAMGNTVRAHRAYIDVLLTPAVSSMDSNWISGIQASALFQLVNMET